MTVTSQLHHRYVTVPSPFHHRYITVTLPSRHQAFQLHGVLKSNLKDVIQAIANIGSNTYGGCGDISRNVTTTRYVTVTLRLHCRATVALPCHRYATVTTTVPPSHDR